VNGATTLALAIIAAGFLALALRLHWEESARAQGADDEARSRARIREELRRQELRGDDRWWLS